MLAEAPQLLIALEQSALGAAIRQECARGPSRGAFGDGYIAPYTL